MLPPASVRVAVALRLTVVASLSSMAVPTLLFEHLVLLLDHDLLPHTLVLHLLPRRPLLEQHVGFRWWCPKHDNGQNSDHVEHPSKLLPA